MREKVLSVLIPRDTLHEDRHLLVPVEKALFIL
jgi:hypothetical protein